ncbi:MAG: alcohol dehydrogenase catalytic domain-containing protein [Proteobacteria bacterium]|nr:alcohol dehydrogenase catalytic domain-containing protein [Pseudomonadota bacterium]
MRAAVYYNNFDVRVEEVERPVIGDGELLVKIVASGICGSDVMEWYRIKKAPIVLGHEIAGVIEEVGAGVERFKVGERVTVAHHVPCNTCRYCLRGEHSVCDTLRSTNFDPGGFAEYIRVPAINVDRGTFVLPDSMSFEEGTFSEPLGCVLRGLTRSGMAPGKSVLVIGSGMSGLLHIRLARALGASVVMATDISDFRKEAARVSGADLVIDAAEDVPSVVKEFMGGRGADGADIVVLCAPVDSAIAQAFASVDRAGSILLFAPKEPGETYPVDLFDLWKDNITLVNSYASPPADTLAAIELIANKRVEVADLVTDRLPLSEASDAFALASTGGKSIKVIIEPHPCSAQGED